MPNEESPEQAAPAPTPAAPVVTESGSGERVPEELAYRIAQITKDLPPDFKFKRLAQITTPMLGELEDGSKTDISMVTTDAIDRDNEVILPKGIQLDDFRRNPTVFYAHNYEKPIGKCKWIKPHANGLSALTAYCKRPKDWNAQAGWLPDAVHSMMQEGVGTGKSIGFIPLSMREPTGDEISRRPELKNVSHVIDKSIMLEYSVAPLPANPDALAMAVSKCVRDRVLADFIATSYGLSLKDAADGDPTETEPMKCPMGHGAPHITSMPGGMYHCKVCKKVYPAEQMRSATDDDSDDKALIWGIDSKSAHDVHLNHAGVSHAIEAAMAGRIHHGAFDGAAVPRNAANANKFLAINTHYNPNESGHWMFPVFSGDQLSAKGVGTAGHYSDPMYPEIHAATVRIAQAIKTHGDEQEKKRAIDLALAAPYYSEHEYQQAAKRSLDGFQRDLLAEASKRLEDTFALLTGKI